MRKSTNEDDYKVKDFSELKREISGMQVSPTATETNENEIELNENNKNDSNDKNTNDDNKKISRSNSKKSNNKDKEKKIKRNILNEQNHDIEGGFLDFAGAALDLHSLSRIFNSYATKKTFATGFFNIALVATNFAQMKMIITLTSKNGYWTPLNIVVMAFVGISLLLQFIVATMLVFLAKQNEFVDEKKRNELIRSNNVATILVLIISVVNIFLNVFISI